jgi:hypothetical protein
MGKENNKMANPLKVLTALSASYGAAVSGSDGLKVQQGGLIVESGTTAVQGLTATTLSGSSTLQVGGTATLAGDVTIGGNLTVNGTTTTVNTENLLVEDKNIILGNGLATTDELADGGGITLSGSTNKTFTWSDSTDSWTSSENMDLAASKAYKLAGTDVLSRVANTNIFANSTAGSMQISNVGISTVSASLVTRLQAPLLQLSGTVGTQVSNGFTVLGASTLAGVTATTVTSSVGVSANVFVLADGFQLSSSAQLGGAAGDATKTGVETAYNAVRFVTSSVLDANGYVEVNLTTTANGATSFATTDLNKISVDVLTRPSGDSNYWNNDLVSVKLEVSASGLWAKIDAPAAPNASYRLIAINESDFDIA